MKKYRSKNEILVWKWTGNKSIIKEINELVKPNNTEHVKFSVSLSDDEKCLILTTKHGISITNEFVYFGQYVIFNIDDNERPFGCYTGEWLNKHFVKL